MNNEIDPKLAVDLSDRKQEQATDLSAEAREGRERKRKLRKLDSKVRRMRAAFSGVAGRPNNRVWIQHHAKDMGL